MNDHAYIPLSPQGGDLALIDVASIEHERKMQCVVDVRPFVRSRLQLVPPPSVSQEGQLLLRQVRARTHHWLLLQIPSKHRAANFGAARVKEETKIEGLMEARSK